MSLSAGNGPRRSEGDRQRTYNEVVILHGCLPFLAFFIRQQLLFPLGQHVRTATRTRVGQHYHQDCLLSSLQLNGVFKLYKDKVRTAVGVVSVLQMSIYAENRKRTCRPVKVSLFLSSGQVAVLMSVATFCWLAR